MPAADYQPNTFTGNSDPSGSDRYEIDGNWSSGHVPTSTEEAIIASYTPSNGGTKTTVKMYGNANYEVHKLTINTGTKLVLTKTNRLLVGLGG